MSKFVLHKPFWTFSMYIAERFVKCTQKSAKLHKLYMHLVHEFVHYSNLEPQWSRFFAESLLILNHDSIRARIISFSYPRLLLLVCCIILGIHLFLCSVSLVQTNNGRKSLVKCQKCNKFCFLIWTTLGIGQTVTNYNHCCLTSLSFMEI